MPAAEPDKSDILTPQSPMENPPLISSEELAALRKTNIALETRNFELRETLRQFRLQLQACESEKELYKRDARKFKNELDQYKNPPLVMGTIEALAGEGRVIVHSTTGPKFLSRVSEHVSPSELIPGAQCALHPQSFVLVEVLPRRYDADVAGMEVESAPDVSYADIGGLESQKELLREAVELPLTRPELFAKVGIEPPKGVLLYGPPGTGKTLLAKAVAHETKAAFIRIVGSELVQKYIGEGARLVREIFALAREKSPTIVFIDEIDAIGSSRSIDAYSAGDHEVNRTLMQLLSELDGFNARGNVKIIAATNRIDILDAALLRPGRFDRIVEFPIPNAAGRREILKIHTKKMNLDKSVSFERIAEITENMNGSELMAVAVEAGMKTIKDGRVRVKQADFEAAVAEVKKGRESAALRAPEGLYV
ncbi:MAG TPA: proteasome-activating nucleotidase [Methanocorpusculum sp.]|nr:proteasome-activating nucleotidase [Methanocorpusculum sp.]